MPNHTTSPFGQFRRINNKKYELYDEPTSWQYDDIASWKAEATEEAKEEGYTSVRFIKNNRNEYACYVNTD